MNFFYNFRAIIFCATQIEHARENITPGQFFIAKNAVLQAVVTVILMDVTAKKHSFTKTNILVQIDDYLGIDISRNSSKIVGKRLKQICYMISL
jgi:hypothetical protein